MISSLVFLVIFVQTIKLKQNHFLFPVLSTGIQTPIDPEDPRLEFCGATFCPWSNINGSAGESPDEAQVYLLFGIYLGCAIAAAIIVAIFVDPLTRSVLALIYLI